MSRIWRGGGHTNFNCWIDIFGMVKSCILVSCCQDHCRLIFKVWPRSDQRFQRNRCLDRCYLDKCLLNKCCMNRCCMDNCGQVLIAMYLLAKSLQYLENLVVKIWSITPDIWLTGQVSLEQLSPGRMSLGQILQEQMSRYIVLYWPKKLTF